MIIVELISVCESNFHLKGLKARFGSHVIELETTIWRLGGDLGDRGKVQISG